MRRKTRPDLIWPSWRYGPDGESAIFNSASEVPFGWSRRPDFIQLDQVSSVDLNRDELVKALEEKGIEINPIWGKAHLKRILDGDISPTR